jgi:hypothetical protein
MAIIGVPGGITSVGTGGAFKTVTAEPPVQDLQTTPEANLRVLLSNTPQFQAATGTATAASAEGFIGIPFDPAYNDAGVAQTNPSPTDFRALIGEDERMMVKNLGTSGAATAGSIPLHFIDGIADGATDENAFLDFKAIVVAVTNDMRTLEGPYLILQNIMATDRPIRTRGSEGDTTLYFKAKFTVEHGVDGL